MMNTSNKLQYFQNSGQDNKLPSWTAGPIIESHDSKGFNRTGSEMKMRDMKTYLFEVYPPTELAQFMQQPSPDVLYHLKQEGIDIDHLDKRHVSFLAQVRLPVDAEDSAVDITLISEQPQNGGVYKQEISIPRNMLCVRDSPVDTVLASLNHALHRYNWYPPY